MFKTKYIDTIHLTTNEKAEPEAAAEAAADAACRRGAAAEAGGRASVGTVRPFPLNGISSYYGICPPTARPRKRSLVLRIDKIHKKSVSRCNKLRVEYSKRTRTKTN